ncbi:MAG: hypothetical protein COW16_02395 [Sphingomonadales bacterium CG12_big_fil_rev_8_21_14_0_65_65_10]|jgi:hypothetical protein|uniref:Stereocilin n=1 Tax=Blastomonas marina TaxID=1867408 RepID=A0ABQ1F489_9SPHN|nr:hypothetical protein [Blastomonas marina]PIW56135.1 MAG: hypothetical protein COW16_02395 [Sphingomonadales bacterium CG12_big_fil_rev_8_21_14_0_65_65_10]WPZ04071.1 hypothetical protein T8S45_00630 [Blastomonas marina]GFZ99550.1 hypothetical protein GCM10010923_04870 [Blastomonas marina]
MASIPPDPTPEETPARPDQAPNETPPPETPHEAPPDRIPHEIEPLQPDTDNPDYTGPEILPPD